MSLVIDTELIRYKWVSVDGQFPGYEKLIPTEALTTAHLDSVEAVKALASLKVLANSKAYPIDLSFNGGVVMSSPDNKGQATIPADIEGVPNKVRIDGAYLTQAMRACGGYSRDLKLSNGYSPVLFTTDGYQLVVMPMMSDEANKQAQVDREARLKSQDERQAEPEPEAEHKPKRNRKREAVAVA